MRGRAGMSYDCLLINVQTVLGMVWNACLMIVISKDLPSLEGVAMLMKGDDSSAVQWMLKCKGGKDPRQAER